MPSVEVTQLTTADWPETEDQTWEFKSSQMAPDKFAAAAVERISGFANSGGGVIIWGVDDTNGAPDGGVELLNGRQSITDWLDKVIGQGVYPHPPYTIATITDADGRGTIDPGKAVLVIGIDASPQAPHQAAKKGTYYFRAGAHNEPAPHALVEALFAKRQVATPILRVIALPNMTLYTKYNLALSNITNTPATNVFITWEVKYPSNSSQDLGGNRHASIVSQGSPRSLNPSGFHRDANGYATWEMTWQDLAGNKYADKGSASLDSLKQPGSDLRSAVHAIEQAIRSLK